MTYPTHKQYAVSFAFIAAMLIDKYSLSEINYYLALPIIIMASKCGGLFPDVDHTWRNVKEKTVPNWVINKFIHITGGKHRSWQTHSIDILIMFGLFSYYVVNKLNVTDINREILSILLIGFYSGWISHIVADMMTSTGVRLFCWNKKIIIKLVPKSIGKLKFNTGHEWEVFCYTFIRRLNMLIGFICIIWPFIPSIIIYVNDFISRLNIN